MAAGSFEEIRALSYGVQGLLLAREQKIIFGERLARYSLCPDPGLWSRVFGKSLYRGWGAAFGWPALLDRVLFMAVRHKLRPKPALYRPLLQQYLGRDFAEDREYLDLLSRLVAALRACRYEAGKGCSVVHDPAVAATVSALFALFYDRLCRTGVIPVFDNAFAGMQARYFHLLQTAVFQRQLIFLVYRDPRDQFVELVRHSVRTRPSMVGAFIRQYKQNMQDSRQLLADSRGKFLRLLSFEEFVCHQAKREDLRRELDQFFADAVLPGGWRAGLFQAAQSRKNIGIWRQSGLRRQMERIMRELPNYLRPEAD
ncbi:hypothetical protein [Desulfurivibrio alkaliphilus]|uniref:Sulfotransferase n=1 Tax=Desulfurivibrio alkaliphilus (strain DSM 19089 / UNIQEM U267 / AHT2) TaxID=589865 RepID=D6Z4L9_DESAT|nr:hypothetical protein [Desulfurivibrio alkaliphilus]ADH86494.1 hypothetical protein DaAHT2_1803 [Desulfurivibrio alkaliphilus AHT 2]